MQQFTSLCHLEENASRYGATYELRPVRVRGGRTVSPESCTCIIGNPEELARALHHSGDGLSKVLFRVVGESTNVDKTGTPVCGSIVTVDYAVVVEPFGEALMHLATVRFGL